MSELFSTEKLDGSLTRIEWEAKLIQEEGNLHIEFNLDTSSLYPVHPALKMSCFYKMLSYLSDDSDSESDEVTPFELTFCLEQMTSAPTFPATNAQSNIQRPSTISVSVNGNELKPFTMKESDNSPFTGKWKSKSFVENLQPRSNRTLRDRETFPLTFIFWIQFELISRAEKSIVRNLLDMLIKQENCDVQFCFDENQFIGGHASILSARSQVFAAMFKYQMTETKTGQVNIQDIEQDIFKDLIYFIYSGRTFKPLNESTAPEIYTAADKYAIDDLKNYCVEFLLKSIHRKNAIRLLCWAHLYGVEDVKQTALNLVARDASLFCKQKEWEELTRNHPELCVIATRYIMKTMDEEMF